MYISYLLDSLNDKQREAVCSSRTNLLVLAGAGSGKTRVIVHRIAWLQSVEKCSPNSIMAVTFTNKAATEMRYRISQVTGTNNQNNMWIGTFHALAYRLLRTHHTDANLPQDFQIIDNEDQLRLLKRLIKAMNLNEKQWSPRKAMWYINGQKDEGIHPYDVQDFDNPTEETWKKVYKNYQDVCDRAGLVDFSEILLRALALWLNRPSILQYYRTRFSDILVDEFQDTNSVQYAWIRMLAGNTSKVMIVGDDDQSIYSWRGAQVKNIQHFLNDFPETKTVCLEQNYRSTSNILNAANALIENNNRRMNKKLWTNDINGELISIYCASNELDEARFVINCIKTWQDNGGNLEQCAILYRNNAQSRVLEEIMLQVGMSYCIYSGMRFFERQEIKDALSYLRLIANRNDDAAFERIVNIPTRGIGEKTLNILRQTACNRHLPLWQACHAMIKENTLSRCASNALKYFIELIETLAQETADVPLDVQTDRVIKGSGLWALYQQEKCKDGQTRIENLKELVTATRQFTSSKRNEHLMLLKEFLSHVTLESDEGHVLPQKKDAVQLMTLHSAKGLEFPQVFIVGMENGIFPTQMSLGEGKYLEEERRLAYVGITRAMQKLTLTYAETRLLYGKKVHHRPSLFISEIPEKYIEKVHFQTRVIDSISHQGTIAQILKKDTNYRLGQKVHHANFGEGIIVNCNGIGKHKLLKVVFRGNKIKWLVAAFSRLEVI